MDKEKYIVRDLYWFFKRILKTKRLRRIIALNINVKYKFLCICFWSVRFSIFSNDIEQSDKLSLLKVSENRAKNGMFLYQCLVSEEEKFLGSS